MTIILTKELKGFFMTGYGTMFMAIYLFIFGLYFTFMNVFPNPNSVLSSTINNMIFIFILIFPMITMRSFAEEKKNKTEPLIFTSPIPLRNVVLGKYFAVIVLFLLTITITGIHAVTLGFFTENIDVNSILTSYIGFILLGSSFIAIGIFISIVSENQIVAGISSLGVSIILFTVSSVSEFIPRDSLSGMFFVVVCILVLSGIIYWLLKNIWITLVTFVLLLGGTMAVFFSRKILFEGIIQKTIKLLSVTNYSNEYFIGVISLSSMVYYLSIIFLFLFFSYVILERRRWS
ncbi:ABC transporter permease [Neobacillus vireti]|uniref:ABC transporter permease n=1 Tax=Neobacillus vireti TaxID=220686 RepID=UPI002FFE1BF8